MTPERYASITWWSLWALVAIVITGTSVRLTGSGLGCSDWPNCEPGEFVPAADLHGWVEFGNRIVTGIVSAVVIVAVAGSLLRRPRRADLVWWSMVLALGVLAQIGLGAVTVLTHLSPPIVMAHFGLSQVLVAAAVVLCEHAQPDASAHQPSSRTSTTLSAALLRAAAPDMRNAPGTDADARSGLSAAPDERSALSALRPHAWAVGALTAVAVVSGTVVTGAGPHGGDEHVERLSLALPAAARIHGITVIVLIACVATLAWRLRSGHDARAAQRTEQAAVQIAQTEQPEQHDQAEQHDEQHDQAEQHDEQHDQAEQHDQTTERRSSARAVAASRIRRLIWVLAAQALVGYVQYFNELPVILVGLHVVGATAAVIAATSLVLAFEPRISTPASRSEEAPLR